MDTLKSSFEDVADWCEKHLEAQRGIEIGMTFGAMLRAYGRLATLPTGLSVKQRAARERELTAKAEKLLFRFSTAFYVSYSGTNYEVIEDYSGHRTNYMYDAKPMPKDDRQE
jgi:hypothetical protein